MWVMKSIRMHDRRGILGEIASISFSAGRSHIFTLGKRGQIVARSNQGDPID